MLQKIAALGDARGKELKATSDQKNAKTALAEAGPALAQLKSHREADPFAETLAKLSAAEATHQGASMKHKEAEQQHKTADQSLAIADQTLRAVLVAELAAAEQRSSQASASVDKEKAAETEALDWLKTHQEDAELADQLATAASAIADLKAARTAATGAWAQWVKKANALPVADAAALEGIDPPAAATAMDAFLSRALAIREEITEQGKKDAELVKLLEDNLRKTRLLASLDEHRKDLVDGEECPLCGALEHPFADGQSPGSEIAKLEAEHATATEALEALREKLRAVQTTHKSLAAERDSVVGAVTAAGDPATALADLLKPLSQKVPAPGAEDELLGALQERERSYRAYAKTADEAKQRRLLAENAAAEAKTLSLELTAKQNKLAPATAKPDPDFQLDTAPPALDAAEQNLQQATQQSQAAATRLQDRGTELKSAVGDLEKISATLEKSVGKSDFADLATLRAARLDQEVVAEIEARDQELRGQAAAAKALLAQAAADIAKLVKGKVLEGEAAEDFRCAQEELTDRRDQLIEELTQARAQRTTDKDLRALRKSKEAELVAELEKVAVWRQLRDLIGSHDGAKFRKYAQGISLDILTRHANGHLKQLSDRYQILRDPDQSKPLNLLIEDLHQAGATRPMASLSGGEKFLTSLALALGLSDLAGRTVRIDSLFIDEGFGSLSSEHLEVALTALETLRHRDKTVGVISHVDLLKERIGTQVLVEQLSGGHSGIRVR